MGFTAFAIEATWPESNRLDRYVRTGVGSPDTLLSGLDVEYRRSLLDPLALTASAA
ncbi:MAG: erythromycin esterase family protein [Gemmatimonadaceae bacterium]